MMCTCGRIACRMGGLPCGSLALLIIFVLLEMWAHCPARLFNVVLYELWAHCLALAAGCFAAAWLCLLYIQCFGSCVFCSKFLKLIADSFGF